MKTSTKVSESLLTGLRRLALLAAVGGSACSAAAYTIESNGKSGALDTADTWGAGRAPNSNDEALLKDTGAACVLTLNDSLTVKSLSFGNFHGTLDLGEGHVLGAYRKGFVEDWGGSQITVKSGTLNYNCDVIVGDWNHNNSHTFTFDGASAVMNQSAGIFYLGCYMPNNRMSILNGAKFVGAGSLVVGNAASVHNPDGNRLSVSGAGSTFESSLTVGNQGTGNAAIFSDGATLSIAGKTLTVGNHGSDSLVSVESGSTATIGTLLVGAGENTDNGKMNSGSAFLVSDPGSSATIGSMEIGRYQNSFCRFVVTNGAQVVVNGETVIGRFYESVSNSVIVSGADSKLELNGTLYVGRDWRSSGNSFVLEDGAKMDYRPANGGNIRIGYYSEKNRLEVKGGAELCVTNAGSGIHVGEAVGNNAVIVRDGGVLNCNTLTLGLSASDCSLEVENGTYRGSMSGAKARLNICNKARIIIGGTNSQCFADGLDFSTAASGSVTGGDVVFNVPKEGFATDHAALSSWYLWARPTKFTVNVAKYEGDRSRTVTLMSWGDGRGAGADATAWPQDMFVLNGEGAAVSRLIVEKNAIKLHTRGDNGLMLLLR